MQKKKYDTGVVLLYLLGKEHFLPKAFRKTIPYSTISTWRKTDYSSYEGHQFRFLFDEDWESIDEHFQRKELERKLRAVGKVWLALQDNWRGVVQEARTDRAVQRKIVRSVHYLREVFGLSMTLKRLRLSPPLYQQWNNREQFSCSGSINALCLRRHPGQLRGEEIQKMKTLLAAPKYQRWPISSIAAFGLRNNKVVVSLYSWYKYARLLNIPRPPIKAERKRIGLRATKPNEYLHIDTTFYPLSTGKKVCITVVMDNFSRMVLGFDLGEKLSFQIVKGALQNALLTISTHQDQSGSFLVSDGGRENHHHQVDSFLESLTDFRLTKIRALKDIQFSNCPIEAIHRILKGRYLRHQKFETLEKLRQCLTEAVFDYNERRPHGRHSPRTPKEVYFDIPLNFDVSKRMRKAAVQRMIKNKSQACSICTGLNICPAKTSSFSGLTPHLTKATYGTP
ncbi:MAG: hypothetical protein EOO53_20460 [Gammaproteobacteria bacterium]|nr:MAG: hypothetical protein EOO53_20460 [Gammaproteobacteria bacterium]